MYSFILKLKNQYDKNILIMFCLFLLFGLPVLAQENEFGDAKLLLLKAQEVYRKRRPAAFDSDTTITFLNNLEVPGAVTKHRYITSYRQDGDRIDVINLRKETIDDKELSTLESRGIWDGETFINRYRDLAVEGENIAYFSKKNSQRQRDILKRVELHCSYLDGFLLNSKEHYASIMLKSENLKLLKEKKNVDGHSCYVLKASSENGDYTVWIDPQYGYNFRQLTVKEGKASSYEVKNVKFKNINSTWFPCEGKLTEHLTYENGTADNLCYESQRTNVIFDPDFDKIKAFKIDLPEGAKLYNFECPDFRWVWQGGEIVKISEIHDKLVGSEAKPLIIEKWYNG